MTNNYPKERKGIAAVQSRIAELEQVWRETPTGDFGIDGHIEFIEGSGEPTGLMVGVQVKSGQSYFENETALIVPYHTTEKHQRYWENYPVPVLLILHHPDRKETYWVDARQEFRTGSADGRKLVVPKSNSFATATVADLFRHAGLTSSEFIRDIPVLLDYMLKARTRNASFEVSFFELFCLGMTNICRSLYFGMDLPLEIAEFKLEAVNSPFGASPSGDEYDFLESYVRFLISQNLVHANYSDLLIDIELRQLVPKFIAPLSRRGATLRELISQQEDRFVTAGILPSSAYRAAQEGFVKLETLLIFPRFDRVAKVAAAIKSNP